MHVDAEEHVVHVESHRAQELAESAYHPAGHTARHSLLCRYGANVGHVRQLEEVPPLQVAQLESQVWQTLLVSERTTNKRAG